MPDQQSVPMDPNEPELSVVLAIIAGGQKTTESCLEALEASAKAHRTECIVPYDARLDGLADLATRFPWVEFIDARSEVGVEAFGAFSREHHDILRAIGLRRARGKIIGLLEDHAPPAPDWCTAVLEAHKQPFAAVGGVVGNGVDRVLNWAVYYCDFGRYQDPMTTGPAEFLSDCNVAYKREALLKVRDLWFDAFHEASINWELRRRGEALMSEPLMVVKQTRNLQLLPALCERFVWGRSFAGTRASEITLFQRLLFAGLSFLLPAILTWRIVSQALRRRRHLNKLTPALPLIFLLEIIWSMGELVGYITQNTGGPRRLPEYGQRRAA